MNFIDVLYSTQDFLLIVGSQIAIIYIMIIRAIGLGYGSTGCKVNHVLLSRFITAERLSGHHCALWYIVLHSFIGAIFNHSFSFYLTCWTQNKYFPLLHDNMIFDRLYRVVA